MCSAIAATRGCRHPHTDCIAPVSVPSDTLLDVSPGEDERAVCATRGEAGLRRVGGFGRGVGWASW